MKGKSSQPSSRPKILTWVRRKLFIECGHCCAVCGETDALEIAHIVPWCKSASHAIDNLIVLCVKCHTRADKEKWGEKTLREYKSRPWILRKTSRHAPVNSAKGFKISIQVEGAPGSLQMNFGRLDDEE